MSRRAGDVCRVPTGDVDEEERFVLLLEEPNSGGCWVLVLGGRVAGHPPGKAIHLKGLVRILEPL